MRKVQYVELVEFVAVTEYRSFRRAAAQLGVSTATLNQAIGAAEDRLGLRLLHPTNPVFRTDAPPASAFWSARGAATPAATHHHLLLTVANRAMISAVSSSAVRRLRS
jgi:hypothetical protein